MSGNKPVEGQVSTTIRIFGCKAYQKGSWLLLALAGNPVSRLGSRGDKGMNEVQGSGIVTRFGTFEVNFQSRELRKHGMRIRLEEKPFQILEMLLDRAGDVVTRSMLRERLWPDTYVAYEHGLNTAVNKLRGLLGDSPRSPRFVETLPRLGYRFIAPVIKPEKAVANESPSAYGAVGSTFQPSTTSSAAPRSAPESNFAVTDFFSPGSREK